LQPETAAVVAAGRGEQDDSTRRDLCLGESSNSNSGGGGGGVNVSDGSQGGSR
jgi:hypothetical protein